MIAAVVVGFFPDFDVLDRLLIKLLEQVDCLIFADNGGGDFFLKELPAERSKVSYIKFSENKGLGFALNEGFKLAVSRGCEYVATFDQDSAPPDLMIDGLLKSHIELQAQGVNCAAISPVFYDHREGEKVKFPIYHEVNGRIQAVQRKLDDSMLVEADVLITSGMLVKVTAWSQAPYDSGLFVDYTDTEWCFRARAKGFRLFVDPKQEMGHALSDAPPIRLFGLSFFRYSPVRRYYYFRNTILFVRKEYVSFSWKKRLILGLGVRFFSSFLIDSKRFSSLKMMCLGIVNGISETDGAFKPK